MNALETEIIDDLFDKGYSTFIGLKDANGNVLSLESVWGQGDIVEFLFNAKTVYLRSNKHGLN